VTRLDRYRALGLGAGVLAVAALGWAAPSRPGDDHDHDTSHGAASSASRRSGGAPAVTLQAQRQAAQSLARKGIMTAPSGGFQPNQPVTKGELAIILVRMIDYLESQGTKKVSQSKSPPLVAPGVRAGLKSLPPRHRGYPALARLANGGYLLPSSGELFLPTAKTINQPVTARELAVALAGISTRIAEKRAALEHPEVLEAQRETVNSPGQRRGAGTPESP
jgi:hypothetical protein